MLEMTSCGRADKVPLELSRQQIDELSEFYWDTDVSTKELKDYFGLSKPVHRYITPLVTGEECPNCSAVLGWVELSVRLRLLQRRTS